MERNTLKKCGIKKEKKRGIKKERKCGIKGRQGGAFTMIEAQGRLFLYNKKTGDVWVCNAFKKTCEQVTVENKD